MTAQKLPILVTTCGARIFCVNSRHIPPMANSKIEEGSVTVVGWTLHSPTPRSRGSGEGSTFRREPGARDRFLNRRDVVGADGGVDHVALVVAFAFARECNASVGARRIVFWKQRSGGRVHAAAVQFWF